MLKLLGCPDSPITTVDMRRITDYPTQAMRGMRKGSAEWW